MSLYAIGDLHFSTSVNKPMDIFGDNWDDHQNKIINKFIRFGIIYIKEENIVVTKDADELNKLFNYIPYDSNTYVDYSRELKDIPSKPIRMELLKK